MEEYFINDDGIRLHAKLERPEGIDRCPVTVVVHGLTGNMEERHIQGVAQALRDAGVATLRVELYGHGQSDGEFAAHTLYKWLDNLLVVIDHAKALSFADGLYLCGHSQGGMACMLAAGMRNDDVDALIALSAANHIPDGARAGNIAQVIVFDPNHVPDEVGTPGIIMLNGDYVRVAQTIHVEEAMDRYAGPVLLVHGEKDEAVPLRYSVEAAARYANARLVTLPGDNHGYDKHLDVVEREARAFVASIRR